MNFVKELEWRGMIHDIMLGTEELFEKEFVTAYVGIDPTADSLHIGHLVGIMMLKHLQLSGHRPIVVLGGATGMIGDPSGKSQERNLLDEQTLGHNQECIKKQLSKFLDFDSDSPNRAIILNNYDWMSKFTFLEFIRDVGKHITINYMIAKDSVKKRISGEDKNGMSFTEFCYQLVQAYDYLHLYRNYNCKLQMGGSDQWGNITTGTELIRRIEKGEAYALTCPLVTKSDGGKFGKTESGNVWLDSAKTSPYEFYQFWLNVSDEDAEKYIKIYTLLSKSEIEALIEEHRKAPHLRLLQQKLAKEITIMVHGEEEYNISVEASKILFGNATKEIIENFDEKILLNVFSGVPVYNVNKKLIIDGISVTELLTEHAAVFPSKSELRRTIKGNGLSINKEKYTDEDGIITTENLIKDKYIIVQKGKKNYHLLICI